MQDFLSTLLYQYLFLANIEYEYWTMNIHLDDYYYLAFHILKIGQVQLICITKKTKTTFFIFDKLLNIILEPILLLQ